eukprot:7940531-Heterocapsa_arctica.AAC.1
MLEAVATLPSAAQAATAPLGAPVSPFALTVLGGWWMCRCIELLAAECSDITLNNILGQVSWSLPVSKRDPQARGEARTH